MYDSRMSSRRPKRGIAMPVKHWNFAGLCLTDWCNASCGCCYMGCSPSRSHWMSVEMAVTIWRQLQEASPHGCAIHLTGGEVFGDWPRLLAVVQRAAQEGLGGLETIETNGFWLTDEDEARRRLVALARAGMGMLAISADPFHQQFVPIDKVRRLAEIARETLGRERVQVRWEDWLDDGEDLATVSDDHRRAVFAEWLTRGHERINGRAASSLADLLERKPIEEFQNSICRKAMLRGKRIHVNPDGTITAGVCAGILLGRWTPDPGGSIAEIWARLSREHASRPVVSTLAMGGPVALAKQAADDGFEPDPRGYVSKCHLCWSIRKHLVGKETHSAEFGPDWFYTI